MDVTAADLSHDINCKPPENWTRHALTVDTFRFVKTRAIRIVAHVAGYHTVTTQQNQVVRVLHLIRNII